MKRPAAKWLVAAGLGLVVLIALIPLGRWERSRHVRSELTGIRGVLEAIGPFDQPALDAYRVGVGRGMDCLLYRRGKNRFALEFCFDGAGRVVEAFDRRGSSPRIWSVREDPTRSTILVDRAALVMLIERMQQPAT